MRVTNPWLMRLRPSPGARLRLFCLPYAGGGTQTFRGWALHLPLDIDLCAVQLPGREKRLREPPYTRLEPLVEEIAWALRDELDLPLAIFGHSMGALLGFELARRLRRDVGWEPAHLFVSCHRAPQVPDPDPPIHNLPKEEFIEELRRLNGTPHELFESSELMEMVLPTIRADFTVCETYAYRPEPPLTCPISAYAGLQDFKTPRSFLEAWGNQTTGGFVARMFPGDHFYIHTSQSLFLETLMRELQALLRVLPHHGG